MMKLVPSFELETSYLYKEIPQPIFLAYIFMTYPRTQYAILQKDNVNRKRVAPFAIVPAHILLLQEKAFTDAYRIYSL